MQQFGHYAVVGETTHYFEKEPAWAWKIKPVTSGMELERSKFMLHNRVISDAAGTRRELPPTWLEIAHREIALTFGGTTIPKLVDRPVEAGGEAILPDGASAAQVEALLKLMPHEMVMELWSAIGRVTLTWGPADEKNEAGAS